MKIIVCAAEWYQQEVTKALSEHDVIQVNSLCGWLDDYDMALVDWEKVNDGSVPKRSIVFMLPRPEREVSEAAAAFRAGAVDVIYTPMTTSTIRQAVDEGIVYARRQK